MEREQLRQVLRDQLENGTGEKWDKLEDGQRLQEDLGLDSVDVVSMVVYFQSEYGISLQSQEFEKIVHVGELLDLLGARIAAAKSAA